MKNYARNIVNQASNKTGNLNDYLPIAEDKESLLKDFKKEIKTKQHEQTIEYIKDSYSKSKQK